MAKSTLTISGNDFSRWSTVTSDVDCNVIINWYRGAIDVTYEKATSTLNITGTINLLD